VAKIYHQVKGTPAPQRAGGRDRHQLPCATRRGRAVVGEELVLAPPAATTVPQLVLTWGKARPTTELITAEMGVPEPVRAEEDSLRGILGWSPIPVVGVGEQSC